MAPCSSGERYTHTPSLPLALATVEEAPALVLGCGSHTARSRVLPLSACAAVISCRCRAGNDADGLGACSTNILVKSALQSMNAAAMALSAAWGEVDCCDVCGADASRLIASELASLLAGTAASVDCRESDVFVRDM